MSGATGVQYVLLETHYNNEMMRSGKFNLFARYSIYSYDILHIYIHSFHADYVDSSGLRLFYTATKRSNDGSIIEIGHFVSLFGWQLFLPPGLNDIVLENVCPGTCTQEVTACIIFFFLLLQVFIAGAHLGTAIQWS
jgi:hypothetical protein